jgi:hypothetical protein
LFEYCIEEVNEKGCKLVCYSRFAPNKKKKIDIRLFVTLSRHHSAPCDRTQRWFCAVNGKVVALTSSGPNRVLLLLDDGVVALIDCTEPHNVKKATLALRINAQDDTLVVEAARLLAADEHHVYVVVQISDKPTPTSTDDAKVVDGASTDKDETEAATSGGGGGGAGDDEEMNDSATADDTWTCARCTLHNAIDAPACVACLAKPSFETTASATTKTTTAAPSSVAKKVKDDDTSHRGKRSVAGSKKPTSSTSAAAATATPVSSVQFKRPTFARLAVDVYAWQSEAALTFERRVPLIGNVVGKPLIEERAGGGSGPDAEMRGKPLRYDPQSDAALTQRRELTVPTNYPDTGARARQMPLMCVSSTQSLERLRLACYVTPDDNDDDDEQHAAASGAANTVTGRDFGFGAPTPSSSSSFTSAPASQTKTPVESQSSSTTTNDDDVANDNNNDDDEKKKSEETSKPVKPKLPRCVLSDQMLKFVVALPPVSTIFVNQFVVAL